MAAIHRLAILTSLAGGTIRYFLIMSKIFSLAALAMETERNGLVYMSWSHIVGRFGGEGDAEVVSLDDRDQTINEDVKWAETHWEFAKDGPCHKTMWKAAGKMVPPE